MSQNVAHERELLTITLPSLLLEDIEREAEDRGITVQDVIEDRLRSAKERHDLGQ